MKTDYYKILRVSHTASKAEIKNSYRKLALEYHPDRNDGCKLKLAEFKRLNEAYQVLMDFTKRREYDFTNGMGYNSNHRRRNPPPPDYRKVYAPRPPPDWKFVWDHKKHFDMHYGDGFQREAIRMMRKELEEEQKAKNKKGGDDSGYQSPLGKGFSFSRDPGENVNPYSKRPQGPQHQPHKKIVFEYEELQRDVGSVGRARVLHRDWIVQDMHARRNERLRQQQPPRGAAQQQQQRPKTTYVTTTTHGASNTVNRSSDCIIL